MRVDPKALAPSTHTLDKPEELPKYSGPSTTFESMFFGLAMGIGSVWVRTWALHDAEKMRMTIWIETRTPEDADAVLERLGDELEKVKPAILWVAITMRIADDA